MSNDQPRVVHPTVAELITEVMRFEKTLAELEAARIHRQAEPPPLHEECIRNDEEFRTASARRKALDASKILDF